MTYYDKVQTTFSSLEIWLNEGLGIAIKKTVDGYKISTHLSEKQLWYRNQSSKQVQKYHFH